MQGKREIRVQLKIPLVKPANMGAGSVVGNTVYCIDFGRYSQNDNNLMCQLSKSGVE